MNQGWTCPKCGRGVAPTEKHCDHGGVQPIGPATSPPLEAKTVDPRFVWPTVVISPVSGKADSNLWIWN